MVPYDKTGVRRPGDGPGSERGATMMRWTLGLIAVSVILLAGPVASGLAAGEAPVSGANVESADAPHQGISTPISAESVPPPSRKGGTYTARFVIGTAVRRRPGWSDPVWYARARTKWSGSSQQLMVMSSRVFHGRTWLKVKLPTRPNRSTGWVPRDRVKLAHTNRFIVVDISRRQVQIFRKGRMISSFRVVVGAAATPTPVGLFAIYDRDRQADPGGFVGPFTLPLTAHSRKLRRYDGGPGLVAFHGRSGASLLDPLGSARSHGCIRMSNRRIIHMASMTLGTAVLIKR